MMIVEYKCGIKAFPLLHTNKYRLVNFVDIKNIFGKGPNAVFSIQGLDKS
jgi:hypothetical protein